MDGQIDDVRIYDYALDVNQIAVLAAGFPAPTGLAATTPTYNQITLNWTAPPQTGVTYTYTIVREVTGTGNWAPIGTSSTTNFVDSTYLFPNTSYSYSVYADSVATSGFSNIATAIPTQPPPRTQKVGNEKDQCGCGSAGPVETGLVFGGVLAVALWLLCGRKS